MKWIVAIVLIFAGVGLYFLYNRERTPDLAVEYRYAVTDVEQIGRISINYRLMDPDILLERKQDFWELNGKYRAREDAINNLLDALKKIDLQFIPNAAARENMIRDLAATGTKVEIYNHRGEVIKAFFIGGVTPDERGTFIIMDGSRSPAVVSLKGFEGTIRPFFIMPESDWRDRIIFREDPDRISELTVYYPGEEHLSFSIIKRDQAYQVVTPWKSPGGEDPAPRPGTVEAYLWKYRSVGAEALLNDPDLRKSLLNKVPFVQITIRRTDHSEYSARFYPVVINGGERISQRIERYHVVDSEGDIWLAQHLLFGPLFQGIDSFFSE